MDNWTAILSHIIPNSREMYKLIVEYSNPHFNHRANSDVKKLREKTLFEP